jgi:hypothetical protein
MHFVYRATRFCMNNEQHGQHNKTENVSKVNGEGRRSHLIMMLRYYEILYDTILHDTFYLIV